MIQIKNILETNIDSYGLIIGGIIDIIMTAFIIGILVGLLLFTKEMIKVFSEDNKKLKKGNQYEDFVARRIVKYFKTVPLRNLIFYYPDGTSTEIDMVFVTTKGVFCLECKYHDPKKVVSIQGSLNDDMWGIMRNPFVQNEGHVNILKANFPKLKIYNIVYINTPFRFKYFGKEKTSKNSGHYVSMLQNDNKALIEYSKKADGTELFVKDLDQLNPVYKENQVKIITDRLSEYIGTDKQRKEHKEQQEMRFS